jgi:hypothetical protein
MVVFQLGLVTPVGSDFTADSPLIGYENRVNTGNITATSAASGLPAINLANPATHLLWRSLVVNGTELIQVSSLTGLEDYFGVASHNFGTAGITVTLQGSTDGGATFTPIAALQPRDDSPIMFYFTAAAYTDFKLVLQAGAVAPQAAVVYVGSVLRLQRRIYVGHTPITLGRRVTSMIGRSQSGNFLGRIVIGEDRKTAVSLQNLTPGWYRQYFDPFVIAAKENPFFFAWRPASYPLEVGYAWLNGDPTPTNQRANGMMQVDLDLSGVT